MSEKTLQEERSGYPEEHEEAHKEHVAWLKDIKQWREEQRICVETLVQVNGFIQQYAQKLQAHEERIVRHEEEIQVHDGAMHNAEQKEQRSDGSATAGKAERGALDILHESFDDRHELAREQHEAFRLYHEALRSAVDELFNFLHEPDEE